MNVVCMVLFLSISNSDYNLEGPGDIQRAREHCPLHLSQYVCASASHELTHPDIQLPCPPLAGIYYDVILLPPVAWELFSQFPKKGSVLKIFSSSFLFQLLTHGQLISKVTITFLHS